MYQKERLEQILSIVRQYGYVTVKFLVNELHYSNATVNRDLNVLAQQKLIHRTYGGVESLEQKGVPLPFRYHKMKTEKLKIGKKAAEYVKDGDVIFLDASTTTEYMLEFLTEKKDVTVLTNNVAAVMRLAEAGVSVVCLGGKIVEPPSMLGGDDTVQTAMRYHADKAFFSTGGATKDGRIGSSETYDLLHRVMAKNSDQIFYLVDHEKFHDGYPYSRFLFDFSEVDCVISDYEFLETLREKFPQTQFVKV